LRKFQGGYLFISRNPGRRRLRAFALGCYASAFQAGLWSSCIITPLIAQNVQTPDAGEDARDPMSRRDEMSITSGEAGAR